MPHKKILVIHLSRLGDMIQSLPAMKLLKEDHRGVKITYLGITEFCLPLQGIPWIDRLVTVPLGDVRGILAEEGDMDGEALERLFQNNPALREPYDVLINLTHSRGSSHISERIRAGEKRGRLRSPAGEIMMAGNWGKYLFAVARNRRDNLLNIVDLYTGMAGVPHRPVASYLPTPPEMDRSCLARLREYGIRPGRPVIGFQLGASKSQRTWPGEHFFRLGELLGEQLDAQIILFGSESERGLADHFPASAPFAVVDLVGRTTLSDLPSFLKHIDLLVSNDTGPMHIAAAVGTRVVGIFMGTAYFRITGPYGCGHIAVQSNYACAPCLDSTVCARPLCGGSILPETVLAGVKSALGRDKGALPDGSGADLYRADFDKNGTLLYTGLAVTRERFLPRLRSFHDTKALVSQALWNRWLGLPPGPGQAQPAGRDGERARVVQDYRHACAAYRDCYRQGTETCQRIIAEFRRPKPRLNFLQDNIAQVERIEQEIKHLDGPLTIMSDIHELYSAEVAYCNFPRLAQEFTRKYHRLMEIIDGFERELAALDERANP